MTEEPALEGPSSSPTQARAPAQAPAGSPAGPAPTPVFGWYIPVGQPFAEGQPFGNGPPGYGRPLGYGIPGYGPPPYGPVGYPPGPVWGPVRPPSFARVPHAEPQPYLRLMRTVNYRWWRPLLGLLAFLGSYLVAAVIVTFAFLAGGLELDLNRLDDLTDPVVLALANASLIVALPAVWLAWVVHTERIGWSSSVLGRIRWRLFLRYGLLALAVLGLGILIGLLVGGGIGPTTGFDGGEYALLLTVVILTTPLQSAAEEYLFRGYLSQAISSWIPSRTGGAILAALLTATLFSFAHAPGDFFTFLDRFAFGLAASAVVWLTGGLEAAIALHAANNVVIFLVIGALGGATSSDIQAESGTAALIVGLDILVMVVYVWMVAKTRKRWHPEILSRTAEPATAEPTRGHPPTSPGPTAAGWDGRSPYWPPPYAPAPYPTPS